MRTHMCTKTWSTSADSMEPDIAVEGVKEIAELYNVRVGTIVGDGDSKLDFHLQSELPEHLKNIDRFLHLNHIVKNFTSSLYNIHLAFQKTKAFPEKAIMVVLFLFD